VPEDGTNGCSCHRLRVGRKATASTASRHDEEAGEWVGIADGLDNGEYKSDCMLLLFRAQCLRKSSAGLWFDPSNSSPSPRIAATRVPMDSEGPGECSDICSSGYSPSPPIRIFFILSLSLEFG